MRDINGDGNDEIAFGISGGLDAPGNVEIYSYEKISRVEGPKSIIPTDFIIDQNFPNPFNPVTVINYQLLKNDYVTLKVYDILGREVVKLVNKEQQAGTYKIEFDASKYNLSSGVYFCELKIKGGDSQRIKMVFIK